MFAFLNELGLKLGDGARGVIDLLFQRGVVGLELGVIIRALGRGVGQAGGKGTGFVYR